MEEKLYYIAVYINNTTYYLYDVEPGTRVVEWTPHASEAFDFSSYSDVEDFVDEFMGKRNDYEIIEI